MKRKFINKLVVGVVISTTLSTLVPLRASAEWVNDYQGNWYYMQDNIKMTGWKKINGQLYYFNENGKMQTGWIKAENSWYFLQNNGAMKTGWINYNKKWYYADSNGAIQTGVINIGGKVYILDNNGAMKTSNTVINGEFYTIGATGEVVGFKAPTPSKEFDDSGNCIQVLQNTDNTVVGSPTESKFNEAVEDQSVSNDDPNQGRIFKVSFKDSNGADLKTKNVKNGKSIDLYEPTKDGYIFKEWNTKSDGSGKSYASDDSIKVKEELNLYAQWSEDTNVYVSEVTIKGGSYVTASKTIQMTAEVSPSEATNKNVTWSVTNGSGQATIDSNGLLTGVSAGTVTVKATAQDASKASATKEVTVSSADVEIPVESIDVVSETGVYAISKDGGTLKMEANISPDNATNQDVTWTVESNGGGANIDQKTGLLTAVSNGAVKVIATSDDGKGNIASGSKIVVISGQSTKVPVKNIVVSGKDGAQSITSDAATGGTSGTLQMVADIEPIDATSKSVKWTVEPCTDGPLASAGKASISAGGILTAQGNGDVKVKAASTDYPNISGETIISISNQSVKLSDFGIQGAGGATEIASDGGTLTMELVNKQPTNGSYKTIKWSVENVAGNGGSAQIDSATGKLTAITNGEVLVKATVTNYDGSQVVKTKTINISGQTKTVDLTGIQIAGKDGATTISTNHGTLQMVANLLPYNQTVSLSSDVTWSVSNGTGSATIGNDDSNRGVLTALSNGTVKVKATSKYNSSIVSSEVTISITGQYIEITGITVNPVGAQVETGGTLQMSSIVTPDYATYKAVKWEVQSITGSATIGQDGLLKAGQIPGDVKVIASDPKNSSVYGSAIVKIVPPVPVQGIAINYPDGTMEITQNGGSIKLLASIDNADATNKAVTWTVTPYTGDAGTEVAGNATIVSTGDLTATLTASANGLVKVRATAKDGKGAYKEAIVSISGQIVKVTGITIVGAGNATTMQVIGGTLQMSATVVPNNANEQGVTWSIVPNGGTGSATITADGLLTAVSAGTVTVKATTKEAGSTISGTQLITINPITSITITGVSAVKAGATLQLGASISPATVTNKSLTWLVENYSPIDAGTPHAAIDDTGKLTALVAGTVKVTATSTDGSGKSAIAYITIQ